jgi:MarR-like DNA-binding transcriptional regulator SgrR of sgrS sRNA
LTTVFTNSKKTPQIPETHLHKHETMWSDHPKQTKHLTQKKPQPPLLNAWICDILSQVLCKHFVLFYIHHHTYLSTATVILDVHINPLPVRFKSLLHGQESCIFSMGI